MRFALWAVGLSVVMTVACGGSDDGGGGGAGTETVDSGLPPGTPANQLTDAQAEALCQSAGKAADAAVGASAQQATCGFAAYFAASFSPGGDAAAACKMAYDECLKQPLDTTEKCTKPRSTCTATVGEIEACLNDSFVQIKQLLAGLPGCDDVGKDVAEPSLQSTSPASCDVVKAKCPEVLANVPDSGTFPG